MDENRLQKARPARQPSAIRKPFERLPPVFLLHFAVAVDQFATQLAYCAGLFCNLLLV